MPYLPSKQEREGTVSRREFLGRAAAWSAGLAASAAPARPGAVEKGAQPAAARLGGPVFGAGSDPERLARAHKQLGYAAAYCPPARAGDLDRVRAIRKAFAREGIVIAEVGRWVNLLARDPKERKANLERVAEGLALAEEAGALCCVDIVGSFHPNVWYGPHPKNISRECFDAAVENARKIIDAVKPRRAKFCYEMMGWTIPDSPDAYLELIRAVDRKAFGAHLDPCNLINSPRRFYDNAAVIRECFRKLGPWIVSCHAKDLAWKIEMNVHFLEVRPGLGQIDYKTYLRELARLPHRPPLMMEHLSKAEDYAAAAAFIRKTGREIGVAVS
ncbi:MAG: sugar phosphate isomerase/epimerase [Verrucomicrobia bacterium]|nr:sugar phosphate isomerase/epimerase [Verrucomicrobiota bacterium]